jgi:hypothetical protein
MTGKREELISEYSADMYRGGNNFLLERGRGKDVSTGSSQLPETQEGNCIAIGYEKSIPLALQLHEER